MHLKKCLIYGVVLSIVSLVFVNPSVTFSHSGGYKPLITINNDFEVENIMIHYVRGQYIPLAVSKAAKSYVVNQSVKFYGIDTAYVWNFGDGTPSVIGKESQHTYGKPGSYIVSINENNAQHTLVDTIQIDILPNASYNLPQSTILVNGQSVVQKFIHYINLTDKKNIHLKAQSGGSIKQYEWEFSDGQKAKGSSITYNYAGSSNSVVALLRITDSNNVIHDEYSYLLFVGNSAQGSESTIITSHQPANVSSFISLDAIAAYYQKPVSLTPFMAILFVILIYGTSYFLHRKALQSKGMPAIAIRIQPYIRTIIYSLSILWATYLYYWVATSIPTTATAIATLMRYYALTALGLLFVVLTPGLIRVYFPMWRYNSLSIYSRRAIGLSLFFFASLHGVIGWLYNLSGSLISIFFLAPRYQLALVCSSTAFTIFSMLALTSSDKAVSLLGGRHWKWLHKFIYIAAILVLFHAFLIGSHFTNPFSGLPLFINSIALSYILLELFATAIQLHKGAQTSIAKKISYALLSFIAFGAFLMSNYVLYKGPYNPHAQHGITGSQQYEVKAHIDSYPLPVNTRVYINFNVYNTKTGDTVDAFDVIQEQVMHVIVLNSELNQYQHIHPTYIGNGTFTLQAAFPQEGFYNLYIDYSPTGNGEITSIIPIHTAHAQKLVPSLQPGVYTKLFKNTYNISFEPYKEIHTNESIDFTYTIIDAKTNKPIEDLQPYLGAFGHLAVVSEDGESFTHVHPIDIPSNILQRGGPKVRFNTLFQKPGMYKFFAQFKHNDNVFVTDFVVQVK